MRFIFLLILFARSLANASPDCAGLVADTSTRRSLEAVITELAGFRRDIDLAYSGGSPQAITAVLERDFQEKLDQALAYAAPELSQAGFVAKLRARIRDYYLQENFDETGNLVFQTQQVESMKADIDGRKGVFFRLYPDSALDIKPSPAESFELMATPVTQILFKAVEELAQARTSKMVWRIKSFNRIYLRDAINIFRFFPGPTAHVARRGFGTRGDTHPADSLNYQDIQDWLNDLNSLSQAGEPVLSELFPGHRPGDVYRLPTLAEWNFAAHHIGQANWEWHGWFCSNSTSVFSLPVALRPSVTVQQGEFYDVVGNVFEMVDNPHDPPDPRGALIVGGSFCTEPIYSKKILKHERGFNVGFRLVRANRSPAP